VTGELFELPSLGEAVPWSGLAELPARPEEFSFVLLSDRTGMARPGVFERAVAITNLLRPDFAIQIGDTIEGYTRDPGELDRQWKEFDELIDPLEVPLFRIPGNHDVSNDLMRQRWLDRHGALHYHFRYRDVLFLVIDTQDPPQPLIEMLRPGDGASYELPAHVAEILADADDVEDEGLMARLSQLLVDEPGSMSDIMKAVKDGAQPANISDAQLDDLLAAVAQHSDVRWTVLLMHMPLWQIAEHPAYTRLREALGSRPYTAFAGHTHNYRRSSVAGREHVRLGSTGGIRLTDSPDGNFDHLSWVTMTPTGPRVANVLTDGVLDADGTALT
jgi:hypothetical protein